MKKISLFLSLFCILTLQLTAQTASTTPPDLFALKTLHSPEFSTARSDDAPLAFPGSEYEDYGGSMGIGITILNGFGVPARIYFNPKNVLEAGMYIGGVVIYDADLEEIQAVKYEFMGGIGYTRFGNRFLKEKSRHNKVRAHGVALRANHMFGEFKTTFASLGWAMETFRENRPNRSFIFELGLQGMFPDFVFEGKRYTEPRPGVYLRCHWNFFVD